MNIAGRFKKICISTGKLETSPEYPAEEMTNNIQKIQREML